MPELDGIETSRRIREQATDTQQPKMILITTSPQDQASEEVKKADLDGLLIKPVSPSSLFDAIMEAFGKGVARRRPVSDVDLAADPTRSIRGAEILLVEDNEINQQVAQEILQGVGLNVTIAENGQVAVDTVSARDFDLILMDIQMPVMDGYEATRTIRQTHELNELPIIAMTANTMAGDREKSLEAGMNDHVAKPIDTGELFSTLSRWIETKTDRPLDEQLPPKTLVEAAEEEPLPRLLGIDVDSGLARVDGNRKLFRKLLGEFGEDYQEVASQIRRAMDEGDQEMAQRLAHTVKGVSGNIGAQEVHLVPTALDAALKQGDFEEARRLMESFDGALNKVLDSLSGLASEKEGATEPMAEARAADPKALRAVLLKLKPHVEKRRPKLCAPVIEEVASLSWPGELRREVADLGRLVGKYKFKEAGALLESIMEKL